jgi:hypothetical protein
VWKRQTRILRAVANSAKPEVRRRSFLRAAHCHFRKFWAGLDIQNVGPVVAGCRRDIRLGALSVA